MTEHTIEHYMPRKLPTEQTTTETVSRLKLYTDDHDEAVELQKQVQPIFRQLTLQEIIREAVHEGLPAVIKRYTAAVAAAKEADKNKS